MSCGQSEMWMMRAIDGTLAAPDRERFADHLGTCLHCRAEWEALNSVERMLASPQMLRPAPGFADRVEARITHYEAQRRTLVGGLILLGAAAALCLLAVPSLLNGRSPIEAYGEFLQSAYSLLSGGLVLSYRLAAALWLTLEALSRSADIPLTSLLTYAAGALLAVAAWRRTLTSQRAHPQTARNGR